MNEKFIYRNIWGEIMMYLWILPTLAMFGMCAGFKDSIAVFLIAVIVFPAAWFGIAALLLKMPAELNADESDVEFIFLMKRVRISYDNIKFVEVTHEYEEPQFRGEHGRYNEIIKIVCGDDEYRFENIMNIDLSETAKDPENLAKQFERGVFSRLKGYISGQTGIVYEQTKQYSGEFP